MGELFEILYNKKSRNFLYVTLQLSVSSNKSRRHVTIVQHL